MRSAQPYRYQTWLGAALLVLASGCGVFPSLPGFSHAKAGLAGTAGKDGPAAPGNPGHLPAELIPADHLTPGAPAPEHPPDVWQRLSYTEDQRKVLDLRTRQLAAVIEEKDRALIEATKEVLAANEEIARTRAEMARWKKELTALRDRLRNTEKDNLVTMQSIVALMEQLLDRDKEGGSTKGAELAPPRPATPKVPTE